MTVKKKPIPKSVDNLLLVNKPLFFSSSYLCSLLKKKMKRIYGRRIKVGHSGTLDPLASGLMIICTGKKTKLLASMQSLDKEYVATIKVGATTPCYDGELDENRFYSTAHLTHSFIEKTINSFAWVGGEEEYFNPDAIRIVNNSNYTFSFIGDGGLLSYYSNHKSIGRMCIDSAFNLNLCKFYLSGIMDLFYMFRRSRIQNKIKISSQKK